MPRDPGRYIVHGEQMFVVLAPETLGVFATSLKDRGQGLEEPAFWKGCSDQSEHHGV